MQEIVIKDEKGNQSDISLSKPDAGSTVIKILQDEHYITGTDFEARQLADGIYKMLGISIDDLQRQAFEAGRGKDTKITTWDVAFGNTALKYPTYEDYAKSLTAKTDNNG